MKTTYLLILSALFIVSCSTTKKSTRSREVAMAKSRSNNKVFDQTLKSLGLNVYFANLHAHHFMEYRSGASLNPTLGPGSCGKISSFPQDDARPCRAGVSGEPEFIPSHENITDYFIEACNYAKANGGLDILFITPHTKNGGSLEDTQPRDADTSPEEIKKRHALLNSINQKYNGKFLCGLGQEASSISKGNHINILGHMPAGASDAIPYLFEPGDFAKFYSEVGQRSRDGESVVLQLNHPESARDTYWGDISKYEGPAKNFKDRMNDYGVDDFAPVGCMVKKKLSELGKSVTAPAGCEMVQDSIVDESSLRKTFNELRSVSNDRFRLIEIITPRGATTNSSESFKSVHGRNEKTKDYLPDGFYDYIYYLTMGFKLAPTANQDNHFYNYGSATASRTGVLASSLEESDVVYALDKRKTFASEDRNSKVFMFTEDHSGKHIMGDEFRSPASLINLQVGYSDPDGADKSAEINVYLYGDSTPIDLKTGFKKIKNIIVSKVAINSGEVVTIPVQLEAGNQFIFAEITQSQDFDKIFTAPLWISR